MSEKQRVRVLSLLVAASLVVNIALLVPGGWRTAQNDPLAEKRRTYPMLAARMLTDHPNEAFINFAPLRNQLFRYLDQVDDKVGVYFQYLPTGIAVGYNEDDPFISASLLKLPTVMKVYRMLEDGKITRNNVLEVTPEHVDPGYGALWRGGQGSRVTVEEAIVMSLTSSDNTAHRLLYALSEGRPTDMYDYLDVDLDAVEGEAAITPRNYTSILRSLYFSAYLTNEHSNEILLHLTRGAEGAAFRSVVPPDVPIAQKIGVRQYRNGGNEVYSNCGIVYLPGRPYTLCVMIAADRARAEQETREVARIVYEFVSTR